MEGYLYKWVNYLYGWKLRYFVLRNGVLTYCTAKGQKQKGAVHLNFSEVRMHEKSTSRVVIDTGCFVLHLKAESRELALTWFNALITAKAFSRGEHSSRELKWQTSVDESDLVESPQLTSILLKLSTLQVQMEEQLDSLPVEYSEDPLLQAFLHTSKDFKAMNLITAERQNSGEMGPDLGGMHGAARPRGMTEGQIKREIPNTSGDDSDFEDAKSHLTDTDMFYDAHEEAQSEIQANPPYRKSLPFLRNPNQRINIWKVVKDSIGKELSKMAVPVYFNEPISFLQRFAEDLIYSDVLGRANGEENQFVRLALVACFAVAGYSVTSHRHMKPFNPLLGETFELQRDGFQLISEQVSHHPPVSALYCEHPMFKFWGSTEIKTSFRGAYLLVRPEGSLHVQLASTHEVFTWTKPYSTVHNIIFGRMYVDHHGDIEVLNEHTGDMCRLTMRKRGWFDKDPNHVDGVVLDAYGNKRLTIEGKWTERLTIKDVKTGELREGWAIRPFQEGFEFNYYFSDYTIQLNMPPEMFTQPIARTDSRYRPDQRALELGDLNKAAAEKCRVEEKQRTTRKSLESFGLPWRPHWFHLENDEWIYSGGYWEQKSSNSFCDLPEIF